MSCEFLVKVFAPQKVAEPFSCMHSIYGMWSPPRSSLRLSQCDLIIIWECMYKDRTSVSRQEWHIFSSHGDRGDEIQFSGWLLLRGLEKWETKGISEFCCYLRVCLLKALHSHTLDFSVLQTPGFFLDPFSCEQDFLPFEVCVNKSWSQWAVLRWHTLFGGRSNSCIGFFSLSKNKSKIHL